MGSSVEYLSIWFFPKGLGAYKLVSELVVRVFKRATLRRVLTIEKVE